jgi:hypothetical protein
VPSAEAISAAVISISTSKSKKTDLKKDLIFFLQDKSSFIEVPLRVKSGVKLMGGNERVEIFKHYDPDYS